jgi:hypothetical protein
MKRPLLIFLTVIAVLVIFGAGWIVKGMKDDAAQQAAKTHADSVLQDVTISHRRALDSLVRLQALKDMQVDSLVRRAAWLRMRADSVFAAAFGKDTLLQLARTAADSLPIVMDQLFGAKLAYENVREANDDLVAGRLMHLQSDSIHFAADSVERAAAVVRENALRAVNADLTQRLLAKAERGKILGFIPRPACGPGAALTVGAGATKSATSGKVALGATVATGATLACIIPF